jgi:hypothetical protein
MRCCSLVGIMYAREEVRALTDKVMTMARGAKAEVV